MMPITQFINITLSPEHKTLSMREELPAMGSMSSQPSPHAPQDAVSPAAASPSAKREPHYSPEFDDFAASQQLLDELARAEETELSPTLQTTFRAASRKRTPAASLHPSRPPYPSALAEDDDTVYHDAEAPQSRLQSSPPPTIAVSVPEKKPRAKGRRNLRAKVGMSNPLLELVSSGQSEGATSTPSSLRSRRKRKHADSAEPGSLSQAVSVDATPATHKRKRTESRRSADLETTQSAEESVQDAQAEKDINGLESQLALTALTPDSLPESSHDNGNERAGPSETEDAPMLPRKLLKELKAKAMDAAAASRQARERETVPEDQQPTSPFSEQAEDETEEKEDPDEALSPTAAENATQANDWFMLDAEDDDIAEQETTIPEDDVRSDTEMKTELNAFAGTQHSHAASEGNGDDTAVESKKSSKKSSAEGKSTKERRRAPGKSDRTRKTVARPKQRRSFGTSAAATALLTVRTLNPEPDVRTEGAFTDDEEERIRRAIENYQERKGLQIPELVDIIQLRSDKTGTWSKSKDMNQISQDSKEFWDEIKPICPERKSHTVRTHIRGRYHMFTSGKWAEEEDEQLKELVEQYPNQWPLIYQKMPNRAPTSIQNRWRDYAQYGDRRAIQRWSEGDEELLVRAVSTVAQKNEDERAAAGKPPIDNYTRSDIDWKAVCIEMGKVRNRTQCAEHWAMMSSRSSAPEFRVEIKPRKTHVSEESVHSTPVKRKRTSKTQKSGTSPTNAPKKRERRRLQKKEEDDSSQAGRLDASNMRTGDRMDLVAAIIEGEYEVEEDIDWPRIYDAMRQSWPVTTLQAGWKDLLALVDEQQSLSKVLDDILAHMAANHGDEWDDYYNDAEDRGEEETNTKRTAKKRKSRSKQSTSQPTTPRGYKSSELITQSDDAESEAES
ncbi:hypothetical protein P153DRAFT_435984 [Dothidotthia symphoricarpi CBS 119687]|uniref:Myb-like domain-containing protein n=1 Tax=Dothidotthia symphoricarpi CBS 119687 TaxID=1392245 RepID=A0A6A5ZUK3_9PLEO|nr:uncharacterized protein P153DRAFT_435984 [Dothidotthia symphoricarpi CBS 119687]KAF2123392.1 hypothetical protein P153DRAFT_435984 [Dothidotthia symphoricarpi CBS 119687]